ncbi:MAG: LuxR family transcriptional regulator [Rhodospirillaceae bacterium]|nr:LuxR family transcriptional regulator [Rhodospirillaceae bacterium]|tara:strand:+ start:245 stop:1036 length:792 start_codon:yes stop_codon:yes gene_type:complete
MLVDSHCHLDFDSYDEDRDEVVARARRAGVGVMQTISTRMSTFPGVRAIAERYPDVYCSVGVHPHQAEEEGLDDPAPLIAAADHPKVIGIGETGLDFYYDHSPREKQARSFRAHIAASRETALPLIVHTRDADPETIEILGEEMDAGAFPGLIHCFSTSRYLAEKTMELGFYISVAGIVTFKRSEELRDIVSAIPLERLLVETDAPFLAPVPNRGKRNEPSFVVHTAKLIAELKGVSADELAERTTANFFDLFSKASPGAACG